MANQDDDDFRDRMYRDRDRDERFMQRERERSGSWDDRSSRSWDRDDDRSVGWRSIDRGGMGQSGYGSGREGDRSFDQRRPEYPRSWDDRARERGVDERFAIGRGQSGHESGSNYLGQSGQQMGSHWGNEMGHGSSNSQMGYGGGGGMHGSGWQQNQQGFGYDQNRGMYGQQYGQSSGQNYGSSGQNYGQNYGQSGHSYGHQGFSPSYQGGMSMGQPGMGSSYNQGQPYGGLHFGSSGYGRHMGQNQGYQGYEQGYPHQGGMGLGQHGNFRHQTYSHLGQQNFGHLGPNDTGIDYDQMGRNYGRDFNHMGSQDRSWNRGEEHHESLGQRIKDWFSGHRGKGPSGYQRSDERIRETVCEALSDDDRVDASNIEVTVKNGEVTLSGTVYDRQTKRLAEDCIEHLSGVKDVQNNIRVISREMGRTSTMGVGTGTSLETPTTTSSTVGNGAGKSHRA